MLHHAGYLSGRLKLIPCMMICSHCMPILHAVTLQRSLCAMSQTKKKSQESLCGYRIELTWTFCFCFSLDLAAEALLAMMRFARFGSTLASGAGARWRPPLPLRLGGDPGSSSDCVCAAHPAKRVTSLPA